MMEKISKIVVAGDVTIDWLQWEPTEEEQGEEKGKKTNQQEQVLAPNWEYKKGFNMVARPGGAWLLAAFVAEANNTQVITHRLDSLETPPHVRVVHSTSQLGSCKVSSDQKSDKPQVLRVKHFHGFCGPVSELGNRPAIKDDAPDAGMVILDDAGNGFRDDDSVWPKAIIKKDKVHKPVIILKMHRPLGKGALWRCLIDNHKENLIVVISADDLRDCGVNISRRLSWERTVEDFMWQMANNREIRSLAGCVNLIVRFGIDGAIHYRNHQGKVEATLYYDPMVVEDEYFDACPGKMQGFAGCFVAAFSRNIAEGSVIEPGKGILDGIRCSRRLLRLGFGKASDIPDYPKVQVFAEENSDEDRIECIDIPENMGQGLEVSHRWSILKALTPDSLEQVAYDTVVSGPGANFDKVPIGSFGALMTVDRAEIENFHTMKNLLTEYINKDNVDKPLSIAVFGQPGSGKSFGVKQLAKSIAGDGIVEIEFNVSQFERVDDLAIALSKVQNVALEGKIPLVFFDEFDSNFKGEDLGWLKYFLVPMQDAKFLQGETMHPLGKAIFVFAGGTSFTFGEFSTPKAKAGEDDLSVAEERFRKLKAPDFLSRLRGYVNIMGPNPMGSDDNVYIVRRAVLLRSILERKAKDIIDSNGKAQIDEGVMRAFFKIPDFKHGVRSMEAIIEMSKLMGRSRFGQASLPPKEQLKMHVDADNFIDLLHRDVIFGGSIEEIAKDIHEAFRKDNEKLPPDDPARKGWSELDEGTKEQNRRFAEDIPRKLTEMGYGYSPALGETPQSNSIAEKDIDGFAKKEHEEWLASKESKGWVLGEEKDEKLKTNPLLKPWDELSKEDKEKNRRMIRHIPEHLLKVGFVVYKLME